VTEFRELKNRLDCAKHSGKYCYINPVSGEHEAQDVFKLTLWAKKIVRTFHCTTFNKLIVICLVP
jgi:hypothetical protein